jgi:low molecular weight protein-tyrosine phosphatase
MGSTMRLRRLRNRFINLVLAATAAPVEPRPDCVTRRILFVCLGNVCRSPLAEEILRSKLDAAGLADLVSVDSAGTSSYNAGRPPDWRARWCARRHGLSISDQRARQFVTDDFDRFDEICVMDRKLMRQVLSLARDDEDRRRVALLSVDSEEKEIADPVHGTLADFEQTYSAIDHACDALVARLEALLHERPLATA